MPAAVPTPAQGQEQAPGQGERAGPRHVLAPSSPAPGDTRVGLLYDNSMERHVGPGESPGAGGGDRGWDAALLFLPSPLSRKTVREA